MNPRRFTGLRAAAALLLHHGNRDLEGVNAVLAEIGGDLVRTTHFLLDIGEVFETLMPVLFSNSGQWLVRQTIADLAGLEHGEPQ